MTNLKFLPLLFFFLLFACQDDDDLVEETINLNEPDGVRGLYYAEEEGGDFTTLYDSLITRLSANTNISIVAEVDHARNALGTGTSLRPNRLVIFGNPVLGSPLMEANPLAGLDLPQKMQVYEAEDGDVFMTFNFREYFAERYGVGNVTTLPAIGDAVGNLPQLSGVTGLVLPSSSEEVALREGITTYSASGTVDSVYTALRSALNANSAISIIAEVDHQANAQAVNIDLPPIRLIVFGNPNLGTPLLSEVQSVGIDLPQKILVYQSAEGEVTVAYNDPYYIAERHGISEDLPQLSTINNALQGLATEALGL